MPKVIKPAKITIEGIETKSDHTEYVLVVDGLSRKLFRRFKAFERLRDSLKKTFPDKVFEFPSKSLLSFVNKLTPEITEQRKRGLQHYLDQLLEHPDVVESEAFQVFLDVSLNPTYTLLRDPDHSGWLTKQGHLVKNWKSRFCVLQGSMFYYFKSPQDSEPQGRIDLALAEIVEVPSAVTGRNASFKVYTGDASKPMYFFFADSEESMATWINKMRRVAGGSLAEEARTAMIANMQADTFGDKDNRETGGVGEMFGSFFKGAGDAIANLGRRLTADEDEKPDPAVIQAAGAADAEGDRNTMTSIIEREGEAPATDKPSWYQPMYSSEQLAAPPSVQKDATAPGAATGTGEASAPGSPRSRKAKVARDAGSSGSGRRRGAGGSGRRAAPGGGDQDSAGKRMAARLKRQAEVEARMAAKQAAHEAEEEAQRAAARDRAAQMVASGGAASESVVKPSAMTAGSSVPESPYVSAASGVASISGASAASSGGGSKPGSRRVAPAAGQDSVRKPGGGSGRKPAASAKKIVTSGSPSKGASSPGKKNLTSGSPSKRAGSPGKKNVTSASPTKGPRAKKLGPKPGPGPASTSSARAAQGGKPAPSSAAAFLQRKTASGGGGGAASAAVAAPATSSPSTPAAAKPKKPAGKRPAGGGSGRSAASGGLRSGGARAAGGNKPAAGSGSKISSGGGVGGSKPAAGSGSKISSGSGAGGSRAAPSKPLIPPPASAVVVGASTVGNHADPKIQDQQEMLAYVQHVNHALKYHKMVKDRLPIKPTEAGMTSSLRDGVIYNILINDAAPDTVDERIINLPAAGKAQISKKEAEENHTLALNSARALGARVNVITAKELAEGNMEATIEMLWAIIKISLYTRVTKHPGIGVLKQGSETKMDVHRLRADEILMRWINAKLKAAGVSRRMTNFSKDLADSEIYLRVLKVLKPSVDVATPLNKTSVTDRARDVLGIASGLVHMAYATTTSIVGGNDRLNFAFISILLLSNIS